jgi:4-oxalocrotonate tautomerase
VTYHFNATQHPKVEVRWHEAIIASELAERLQASGRDLTGQSQAPPPDTDDSTQSGAKEDIMPLVQVKVIKGVFDSSQKQEMISQLTETMVNIEGEALRGVTWVTIDEVESGDWGIGGNAITAQYVKDLQKTPAVTR